MPDRTTKNFDELRDVTPLCGSRPPPATCPHHRDPDADNLVRTPTADHTLGADDSGFASVRTPIFSMFPRALQRDPRTRVPLVGRALQPQLGTVEVRTPAPVSAAPSRAMRARRPTRA